MNANVRRLGPEDAETARELVRSFHARTVSEAHIRGLLADPVYIRPRLGRHAVSVLLAVAAFLSLGCALGQTTNARKIGDGTEPAWSPYGQWILVSVLMDDQRDLFVVRPDGSERRQITDTPESELLAAWSSEGRVAYISPTDIGLRLIVMDDPLRDVGQSHEVRLRGLSLAFTSAPWTPDGAALTVVAGRYPEVDVFRVPVDGSAHAPLVANPGYDSSPAWSRDGRLAFVSDRSGNRDIWVRDHEGALRQLTTGAATDDNPAWSPDGRWIAFASDRSGNRELHVVSAEGGSATQITNNSARVAYPAWSPDGSMLAYVLVTSGRGNDQLMTVAVPAELRSR